MEVGLTPDEFWQATWYELELFSQRHVHQVERQWDYTRHLMAAMGAGKGRPKDIVQLPTIDNIRRQAAGKAPSLQEQEDMIHRFKHFFS